MVFKFYLIIRLATIVRADSVRKDNIRFPKGAMVMEWGGLYTVAKFDVSY
jgi:hypothetical protein